MIITALLNLIQKLLDFLLSPIEIPQLPEGVEAVFSKALSYLADGLGIFAAFTHFDYIMTLFVTVIVIDSAMLVYKFVRWVLQKIPMAGIK